MKAIADDKGHIVLVIKPYGKYKRKYTRIVSIKATPLMEFVINVSRGSEENG